MPIPAIDFAPFLAGSADGKAAVAAQIDAAARDIGFFLLAGHGVEQPLIDATYAAVSDFFDLPEPEKLKIRQPAPEISRGYTPFQGEGLAAGLGDDTPPDLKEMIDIGPVDVPEKGPDTAYWHGPDAGQHFHANLWPDAPADFETTLTAYYRRMNALADDLMRAFALALDLPEAFFADKLDKNMSALRVIRYPEQHEPPKPGQLRGGAHTDYGTLTILAADRAAGGLQARHRNGDWIDVLPEPGTYVVNIGDAMQVWTNDRWISTLHRVVNPPADKAATARRHSLPFFHQPNHDALIAPLPSCVPPGEAPRHPPMTFGEHWMSKWMATKAA